MAFNEMLLNDSFKHFRCDGVIPGSVGINDGDGALLANAKTVRFCTKNAIVRPRESQLFKTPLEVVPRFESGFLRCAPGLRLIGAKKNVLPDFLDFEFFDDFIEVRHNLIINDQGHERLRMPARSLRWLKEIRAAERGVLSPAQSHNQVRAIAVQCTPYR